MATANTTLEMVLKARDEASAKIQQVTRNLGDLGNQVQDLKSIFNTALGALSAYAGTKGLESIIRASIESQTQLAQARFFLAGYGKEVEKNFAEIRRWATGVQQQIGAGDEYATLVASKLMPRIKDLSKAQADALILLRGERLGLLNASEAANIMIRATQGNERAMRFLVEQLGISAPEFVGLQTLFAELSKRINEAEKSLPPFATQVRILKENFDNFMQAAGLPIVTWLATFFQWVNGLIQRFPILGTVISAAMVTVALALAGLGVAMLLKSPLIIGAFELIAAAASFVFANPIILLIGAVIAAVILLATHWDQVKAFLQVVWLSIQVIAQKVWTAISDTVVGIGTTVIETLQNLWNGFKDFWVGLWEGIKGTVSGAWDWISSKVQEIINKVNDAVRAVTSLPGVSAAINVANKVGSIISGKRAFGGAVEVGNAYLVGERGAELFVPSVSGTIIPNAGGTLVVDMRNSMFLDERAAVQIGDMIISRLKKVHRLGM